MAAKKRAKASTAKATKAGAKGTSAKRVTNFDRLKEAGVLDTRKLRKQDKPLVETLSAGEVDTLIGIHRKFVPRARGGVRMSETGEKSVPRPSWL